jgi:hypothetical protein
MKLKVLVLAVAAAAVTASAALGNPPASHPGNGSKPSTTGVNCKPEITVVLHGTVAAAPGSAPALPFSLMVTVKSANSLGKAFVNPSTPLGISVTSSTHVSRQGSKTLSSLLQNDQVTIQARTCKAALANGAKPALTATTVTAHPAKA